MNDPPSYVAFCQSSLIVTGGISELHSDNCSNDDVGVSMKDILYGFIADCVRKYPNGFQSKSNQNILALGYRCKVKNFFRLFAF